MWRTRPCDRRDPGTGNSATNSKLPRPSIKAASDHAGPLRTPFPSRRLRFLKPRQVVVCLIEPRSNGIAVKPAGCPPKTLEFSCRPPRKSSRPLESLQKTRYATSRNPRNGAAILAVPRLNLLCSPGGSRVRDDAVILQRPVLRPAYRCLPQRNDDAQRSRSAGKDAEQRGSPN